MHAAVASVSAADAPEVTSGPFAAQPLCDVLARGTLQIFEDYRMKRRLSYRALYFAAALLAAVRIGIGPSGVDDFFDAEGFA